MKTMKRLTALFLAAALVLLTGCTRTPDAGEHTPPDPSAPESTSPAGADVRVLTVEPRRGAVSSPDAASRFPGAHVITLSGHTALLDGEGVEEFDYVWHADPTVSHDEVKDCPAQYYTGTEPDTDAAVYIAHDVIYYPELPAESFTRALYDGETEYVCYYSDGEHDDYLFSTLPVLGSDLPTQMMHSEAEAYENPVLHIQSSGTYLLEGSWDGQILIDLGDGDENFTDPDKAVTLVLNGADICCTVAPGVIFRDLYECDNGWEERETQSGTVDTAGAGARVILADGSVNSVSGANVFRLLKAKYKDESSTDEVKVQKKSVKTDGAFYSYVSMNIDGEASGTGALTVTGTTFEGLDSELHLTVNSGNITIYSADDGINVNEDNVSVFTMNGGTLHVFAGLGAEGDGIDSNGYVTVNGGTLVAAANPVSDNGIDSECGTAVNGGDVVALGSSMGGSTYGIYVDGQAQYGSSVGGGFGPGGMGGGTPPERPDGAPGGGFDPGASGRGDTPPSPPQG